ncbi:MAG TPA: choice-of-anchor J domain-containing protein, partial [Ignavibacteriaceae bacterium]|nr:choice-of-anchor J domain-containing protein [Ignavibacteriaceae bacterium]
MFRNFFKFISVVFLLAVFATSVFAQTTLISPTGDGGFENGGTPAANGWTAVNSTVDSWVVGLATPPGPSAGTNAGYISTDGGTTWAYSQLSTIQHLYKDITIPAGESIVNLSFKWRVGGEGAATSDWDNMKVFWGVAATMGLPVANTAISATYQVSGPGATNGMYKLSSATYNNETISLTGTPGATYRLVFSWKSDVSTIANPPAAIDEVSLISRVPITPVPPISFTATNITTTGMDIGWTDNSTDEVLFRVYRSTDNINFIKNGSDIPSTSVGTTGTLYSQTQTGLLPGVTYYFRIAAFTDFESAYLTGSQATLAGGSITSNGTGGGLWSATTTWTGGVVPTATDNVTILNGDVVTLDGTTPVCNNLTIGGGTSGTLEYQATPLAGLTVNGNLTVAAGGTFSAGTGTLTTHTLAIGSATGAESGVSGSLINNGTFDLNTTAGVTTTFLGLGNESISGTGLTTDFYAITVNKGTTRTGATLDVTIPITMSLVTSSTNRLVLTNGTFKLSSASTLQPAGGSQTIVAAGGRLWLNNASAVYNGVFAGSPTVAGEFRIDAGTFNYGSGNNTFTFSNTATPGSVFTMNGGTINFLGAVSFSSDVDVQFNMSGGNFNVDPQATNLSTTTTTFSIGASTTVNWSGGVVTVIDPRATAGGSAYGNATAANKIITGGKLRLGDGVSVTTGGTLSNTSGFGISGVVWDLEIDNRTDASTSRMARVTGTTFVLNQLEIKANSYLFIGTGTTSTFLVPVGNVINNGTLAGCEPGGTQHIGTFYWQGVGAQSLTGNGVFTNMATMSIFNLGTPFNFAELEFLEANEQYNREADLSGEIREHLPIAKLPKGAGSNPLSNTVTLLNTQPFVVNRVNLFSGTINPGGNLTIGKAGISIPLIQVGGTTAPGNPAGSFTTTPLFDNTSGFSTYIYSTALGSLTTGAYNELPAGPQTWNQVLINDADGLFLDRPVTVANFMTFTLGNINTTSTNLLTYVATTALVASATSYVNGPFARVIPANQTAALTLNYPVGKGSYKPVFLVDPVTTIDGPVTISTEIFDANSGGTPGTGLTALNTNRYWNASIISGGANFTSTKIQLTEDGLTNSNGMGKSETVNGAYNLVSSAVPSGGTITSNVLTSLSYFAIGTLDLSVADPTGVTATAISGSQIDVAFTPSGNNVVIVWNLTGTFTPPTVPPVVGDPLAGGTVLSIGTTSPVNHTGLNQLTTYYYKAFSYNGTDYSFGVTASATTLLAAVTTYPFFEGFEVNNVNATPVFGWLQEAVTGTNVWTANNIETTFNRTPRTGSWNAYLRYGNERWLFKPFELTGGVSYTFEMYTRQDGATAANSHMTVSYGSSPTGASMTNPIVPQTGIINGNYQRLFGSFTPATTGVYYIGIKGFMNSSPWYISLDDISVYLTPTEPTFSIAPASKDFGSLVAGTTSAPQNFIITNIGVGTLTISAGSLTGANSDQFVISAESYPISIGAGASDTVAVTFAPTSAGVKSANLQLTHNAVGSPAIIPLTGSALPLGTLFEDFTGTTFPPAGWLAFNNDGGTKNWLRNTGSFNSPPASASSSWESGTIRNNDWLISPRVVVASGDSIIFFMRAGSTSFPETVVLKVGSTPSPTASWTTIDSITTNLTTWQRKSYSLSAFNGQNVYIAWVNRGLDQLTVYVDDVLGPVKYVTQNDIGLASYSQPTTEHSFVTGVSRDYAMKDPNVRTNNISISLVQEVQNSPIDSPIDFKVIVQNFGAATQNSYQVGWKIDNTNQASVNNTEPLTPGDTDTLTLTWAVPVAGIHTSKAWTILAGDENPINDSSATITFYAPPANSVFLEGFEDATFPPAGWLDINADGGGLISWFQGNPTVFPALTGNGYAATNYQGANASGVVDQWLITPNTGGSSTDTDSLVFYLRTPAGSIWPDSIQIRVSTTGTNTADFTLLLGYIMVPINNQWNRFAYALPNAVNRYIAFRYLIYDTNTNANYAGLDLVEIQRHTATNTFQLTVNVADGWNMVSIPGLNTPDQNVNTWWAFRDPGANVFRYAGGYQAVTDAAPGIGYWMKHAGALTYNTGEEWPAGGIQIVAHDPIAGASGWNMFGGYELSVPTANVTTNPAGQQSGPIYAYSGGYQVATTLTPGLGYWIKLNAAAQIIIPESQAKGEVVEYFPEDWGRIILTDATGINYTLYAVKGQVDLSQYELPPTPPTGMFDIRFNSGRIAEDINSSVKTIDMSGVTYPLTVRVEGMDMRLMDETGKAINVNL